MSFVWEHNSPPAVKTGIQFVRVAYYFFKDWYTNLNIYSKLKNRWEYISLSSYYYRSDHHKLWTV